MLFCKGLPLCHRWDFLTFISFSFFIPAEKRGLNSLDIPRGNVSSLKVKAGRGMSGSLLTVAVGLSPLMGYWLPMGWRHEAAIHHSHVHVSSDFPVPPPLGPPKQIMHHVNKLPPTQLSRHFLFVPFPSLRLSLSPLLFPFPLLRTNHTQVSFPQQYTTWTLGALSSNPPPVLSQH